MTGSVTARCFARCLLEIDLMTQLLPWRIPTLTSTHMQKGSLEKNCMKSIKELTGIKISVGVGAKGQHCGMRGIWKELHKPRASQGKTVGRRREAVPRRGWMRSTWRTGGGNEDMQGVSVKSAVQSGLFKVQGTPAKQRQGKCLRGYVWGVWVKGDEFVLGRKALRNLTKEWHERG